MEQEISPRETAVRLGCRMEFVYTLLWAGQLRGRKVDGRWRVNAEDVDARVKAKEQRVASSRASSPAA